VIPHLRRMFVEPRDFASFHGRSWQWHHSPATYSPLLKIREQRTRGSRATARNNKATTHPGFHFPIARFRRIKCYIDTHRIHKSITNFVHRPADRKERLPENRRLSREISETTIPSEKDREIPTETWKIQASPPPGPVSGRQVNPECGDWTNGSRHAVQGLLRCEKGAKTVHAFFDSRQRSRGECEPEVSFRLENGTWQ